MGISLGNCYHYDGQRKRERMEKMREKICKRGQLIFNYCYVKRAVYHKYIEKIYNCDQSRKYISQNTYLSRKLFKSYLQGT